MTTRGLILAVLASGLILYMLMTVSSTTTRRLATVRRRSYDGWPQSTALPYLGRFEGIKRKMVWGHSDRKRADTVGEFPPAVDRPEAGQPRKGSEAVAPDPGGSRRIRQQYPAVFE